VIFDGILNRPPTAPVRLNPALPPELERIINKALEKDRDLRYQVASEMRADLRRLKREIESGKSSAVSAAVPVPPAAANEGSSPASGSSSVAVSRSPSQSVAAIAPRIASKPHYWIATAFVVVAIMAAGFWYSRSRSRSSTSQIESIAVIPFTNIARQRGY
jgi:eukaryotic-like serine/threonine-protein kinase